MASPQEVQAMQQQLQALQEQTTALNEGLRRASQAHEMTQRRLTETETQLAAARGSTNRASKPGEESHTPQQCAQTTNIQWKERRVGKCSNTFSQHGQAQSMVSILSSWKSMEQLRIELMKLLLPRKKIVWQKRCIPS